MRRLVTWEEMWDRLEATGDRFHCERCAMCHEKIKNEDAWEHLEIPTPIFYTHKEHCSTEDGTPIP